MYCGKCGKEIEVTERFCRHCGAKNDYFKEKFSVEDVVQGIKDRNEKAIEEFYSLTYKQGFSVAIQIVKNEQDAMDLLQDAYLSALTKTEQLESSAKIKSWFNCIVANRCRDWLRKKKGRNTQLFAELENDEYDEGVEDRFANENMQFSPDESADYAETKRLMQEILDKLPEDQRLCILMYYYEELSVGEIAQALECSTGTVKSRLNYARKKIKNEVEELERKGTKLYGIAPLPFIVWMLSSGERTLEVKASGLEKWRQYIANSEAKQIAVKNAKTGSDHITESAKAGAGHIAESAKTGAGHIAKRAVAGIVAAAVVGTGAYIGYTKYIAKPADTKQEQVKQENTAKQEKETIPEFTLTDEQKEQIQYYLEVGVLEWDDDYSRDFELSSSTVADDNWGSIEKAPEIKCNTWKKGVLEYDDDVDRYFVKLPKDKKEHAFIVNSDRDIRATFEDVNGVYKDHFGIDAYETNNEYREIGRGQRVYIKIDGSEYANYKIKVTSPTPKKTISILKVSKCKKGMKVVKGKTISKANVKVTVNGKAYKTVKSNAKGNFAVKTKKLKAGQKIKVTVSKSGYKTRTSGTIKVKKK